MRLYLLLLLLFTNCTAKQQTTSELILGNWSYDKAESLGDYSQNDSASKAEFDKTMEGKILTFNTDGTYKSVRKLNGVETNIQTGFYSIKSDGKAMTMDKGKEIKIFLSDGVFKIYSPNNAILDWKKIKD